MKDWFKVFWLRWKLRLFARDVCRIHFCKMRQKWGGRNGTRLLNVCEDCERAKKVAEQLKRERKHWRNEEIEDACVEQRKKLGLPVVETMEARVMPQPAEPQPLQPTVGEHTWRTQWMVGQNAMVGGTLAEDTVGVATNTIATAPTDRWEETWENTTQP